MIATINSIMMTARMKITGIMDLGVKTIETRMRTTVMKMGRTRMMTMNT